jgi:hypothetical protein
MGSTAQVSYSAAVNEALRRLEGYGFEWGPGFAFHAPMAAEALAQLGHCDEVGGWVESNRRQRGYRERPTPRWPIEPDDWREALGDFGRVADWARLFEQELSTHPWQEVLIGWWPRLLPGSWGALGHGLIRTAHAARSVATVDEPTEVQLGELAQGLGYWAARHAEPRVATPPEQPAAGQPVEVALRELTASMAGRFADWAPQPAIPLVHTITVPAAIGLMLPLLPAELHQLSFRYAQLTAARIHEAFQAVRRPAPLVAEGSAPALERTVAAAVDSGDEHAIKLAEVCVREYAADSDERFLRAGATLTRIILG